MSGRTSTGRGGLPALWEVLTSHQVAVVLLLTTLPWLLLALLIPQEPSGADPAALSEWRATLAARLGSRFDLYDRMGLLHVLRTPTFLALLGALLANTLACTVERWGRIWRAAMRRPPLRLPEEAYAAADWRAAPISAEQARRLLRRGGYRLLEEGESPRYFYGERFRLAALGTLLTHLGLFFFVLAAFLHTTLAWRERLLLDPVPLGGSAVALSRRPLCRLGNGGFEATFQSGALRRLRGHLQVEQGQREIEGWAAPGAPLAACGVRLYLVSYGLALRVEAYGSDGTPLRVVLPEGKGELLRFAEGTPEQVFNIPALGWHVAVAPSARALAGMPEEPLDLRVDAAGRGSPLFVGAVRPGEDLDLPGGGRLRLTADTFLLVEAVYDPGFPAFLAGGLAVILGSTSTLLFPQRRLWARLTSEGVLQVRFQPRDEHARAVMQATLSGAGRAMGGSGR